MSGSTVRTSRLIVAIAILSLVVAACGSAATPAPTATPKATGTAAPSPTTAGSPTPPPVVALRVAIVPGVTSLPAIVAKGAGIFDKNFLNVTLTIVPNLATLPGTMGKQFDIGLTTAPDIINANLQGIKIALVSGTVYDNPSTETAGVVVKGDSPIKGPADLVGKTVGAVTLGGNIHPATLFWLRQNSVDVKRITFIEVPSANQLDQLQAGTIAAVQCIEPFKGQMKAAGGRVLTDPMDAVISANNVKTLSFLDFMASRDWAEQNPDVLARWVTSLQEAIKYIAAQEKDARRIFQEISGLPATVTNTVVLPNYGTNVSGPEIEAWASVMKANGQLDAAYKVDVKALVMTPAANLVNQR